MSNPPDTLAGRRPAPRPEDAREETFARRWSRRKQEARAQQAAVAREAPPPTESAPVAPAKVLTDVDMPALESLGQDSDFSVFMSSGVSEALRRQALRKLFLLPGIGERYQLESEYYDCHGFEPLGNIVTHEMREEIERAARELKDTATALLSEDGKDGVGTSLKPVEQQAPADAHCAASAPAPLAAEVNQSNPMPPQPAGAATAVAAPSTPNNEQPKST